ncbi:MAG: RHS repeat-associated core domain-containing protein [Acidobacteria bacterium]|nr:RHS repeat-associated core domain-containing protein [Acidobacteriota bacterium]
MKFEPETGYQSYSSFSALNQPWLRIEGATSSGSASASSRSRNLVMDGLGRLLSECSTFNGSTAARNFTYSGAFLTDSSNSVTGANAYTVTQHFDYFEASQGAFLKDEITTQLGLTSMIQYTYTDLGVLNSLTYPDGRVVNYGFDNLGRAITVTTSLNGVTQSIIPAPPSSPFDQWGNRGSITFQSGAKDTWGRDAHGRLGSTTVIPASGSPVGWSYQYDPTTGWLTSTGEWGLGLDSMGRLTSASQAWALALDSNGNATQSNVGLLSNDLVQDAFSNNTYTNTTSTAALPAAINNFSITNPLVSNQLPGFDKNGALIGATYDLFSEITQINTAIGTGSPTLSMAWDPLGRLATVGQSRTSAAQGYHYAPSGVRVASMDLVDASNNRAYIYTTNGQLLSEYVTSANAVKSATPVDLWANSSSGTMTVPASGWVGQAPAPQPCVPGDVFYAGAYVRTVGMTTGTAHIGIRFDSDTQIGIGWSQVLGDGTPPSTTSPDRIRLGCMGIAPAGATKAVFYIECGPCNPGAMASIDSIAFSKGSPLSSTSAAIPLDLWTGGSTAVLTVPASGWVGQAQAPQACVPGDIFYATTYVRTVGMTTGTAHIGIRFDSDTQIGIGWSQVLGDGTPPSTISPDRIRLGCMGIAPAGATKAVFYIECGPCNPGAMASIDSIAFSKGSPLSSTSAAIPLDLWTGGSAAVFTIPASGWVGQAPAPQACVPGDVFYAGAYVRTVGMTTGTAHIGIRFDSDTQIGIGWSQVLGDGTPPSTISPDRIRLGCMGIAPAGATKALFYIECGPCNPGAIASFDTVAFTKGLSTSSNSMVGSRDVIYLDGRAIAEMDSAGLVHELHNDHLGTPRLITNGITGSVEGSQTYGPYGETIGGWGYVPLTGYTGHIQTEPNGLIYMRGRFYSPAWHQFLNSDQGADPAQGNQYAYAGGNPFTRVDPSGMFSWSLPRLLSAFGHSLAHLGTQIFNSMNQGGYGEMQQFASEFVADQRNRWKSQQTDLTAQEDDSTDFAGASNTKLSVSPGIAGTDVATTGIVINYTDLPMMTPEPNTITWMAHGLPGVVEGVTPEQMASDAKGFKGWEAASKYLAVCYGGSGVLGRDGSIRLQPIAQRVADALGPNQVVNGDQYLHRQNWSGGSTTRLDSYLGGKSWFVNAGWIPTHWLSYTAGTSRTSGEIQVPYGCFVVPNR